MLRTHRTAGIAALIVLGWFVVLGPACAQQTVSIEGTYEGPMWFHSLFHDFIAFGVTGEDPDAASGLTTLGYGGEGVLGPGTILPKFANLDFSNGRGDRLFATEAFGGGAFTVTGGEGAFAGATGGGVLETTYDFATRRGRINVRGTATVVPEPSTLALLALASTGLLRPRRSDRQSMAFTKKVRGTR